MKRKEIILPKVYHPKNNSLKGWFVYFSLFDDYSGKMKRIKRKEGFTKCKTLVECNRNAQILRDKYRKKILDGWSPFKEKGVVWSDHLEYNNTKKKVKPVRRSGKTISFYCSEYLNIKKNTWSKGSYDKSQSELRRFQKWIKKNKKDKQDISEFNIKNAFSFFKYLIEEKKLAGSTLNGYAITVRGVWKLIMKQNVMIKDPWVEIPKYDLKTKPQRPLKRGAISLLKSELEKNDNQLWLAAQFMYYCFIRPKELRFMKIKDIDLYDGRITLNGDITKSKKARTVEISTTFLDLLLSKYEFHTYPDDHYVFTLSGKPGEKPIGKNYFGFHFDKVRTDLNLPKDYKFYSFKHTGAVAALKAGADIKEIQHQMGHSSVQITDEYLKSMVGYESEFFKKRMPGI